MELRHLTLITKPNNGKITISAEILVTGDDDEYVVTIDVVPHAPAPSQTLDDLYGALADCPLPEIVTDLSPEQRDDI